MLPSAFPSTTPVRGRLCTRDSGEEIPSAAAGFQSLAARVERVEQSVRQELQPGKTNHAGGEFNSGVCGRFMGFSGFVVKNRSFI